MAKLSLNPHPVFKAKVPIPVAGSEPAEVMFTFKYRTRSELREYSKAIAELADDANEVSTFRDFVVGWDLDDAFTDENIARLLDVYPGASGAVSLVYLRESAGVRRGN